LKLSNPEPIFLNGVTDIKNVMTGWANKKPFGRITIPCEHGMKSILVTACRTDFKLGIQFNSFNFVIHTILPAGIWFHHQNENL
jgi:hypothetical protein